MTKKKKSIILFIFLLLLLTLPLLDLLTPGFPLTHDGKDHLARVASFFINLQEGTLIPRWAGGLNWGYGHPILMFLYPLSSYAISLIHALSFSLVDSVKIFFALSYVASGLTMYLFIKKLFDEKSAVVAALLYTIAPYRFVDLYVRGALGEHTAFIFPPLIAYFMLSLQKSKSYWTIVGLTLSITALILSHNAISIMFFPLLTLFAIYLLNNTKDKKRYLILLLTSLVLGFGIASFFWIPAVLEGKYTLRDIVVGDEYKNSFVALKDLVYGHWDYRGTGKFTVQLGIVQWLAVIGAVVILFVKKAKNRPLLIGSLFILLGSLFLMTSYSGFLWQYIPLLSKFQFPWRFLTVSVSITALLGALVFYCLPSSKKTIGIFLIAILLIIINFTYWKGQSYVYFKDSFFTKTYEGTTDTGESAPIWSVRFMEKSAKDTIEVIEGKAVITKVQRTNTNHLYAVNAKENTRIKENTLYFPGWIILVDNKEVPIEFQDQKYHGIMTFRLPKGLHKVEVVFRDTKIRTAANILSFTSAGLLLLLGILWNKKLWKRYQLS